MSAEMVAVKISKLEGKALDHAVAQARGQSTAERIFPYSQGWDLTGPLIEELQMNFATLGGQCRNRSRSKTNPPLRIVAMPGIADRYHSMDGPTHLIAACRCYVLAKMSMDADGEVMVPASLVTQ